MVNTVLTAVAYLGEGWMDGWMKREDRVRIRDEQ